MSMHGHIPLWKSGVLYTLKTRSDAYLTPVVWLFRLPLRLYFKIYFRFRSATARGPPPDRDRSADVGFVVYRLRDHVQDHQTGGRSPGVFHAVQEVRRPATAVVRTPRPAAVWIVGPDDGGRFRDPKQRVQPSARAEELANPPGYPGIRVGQKTKKKPPSWLKSFASPTKNTHMRTDGTQINITFVCCVHKKNHIGRTIRKIQQNIY